jgi:hypothetical protein
MENLDLSEIASSIESGASDIGSNVDDFAGQAEALMSNWHHCSPQ